MAWLNLQFGKALVGGGANVLAEKVENLPLVFDGDDSWKLAAQFGREVPHDRFEILGEAGDEGVHLVGGDIIGFKQFEAMVGQRLLRQLQLSCCVLDGNRLAFLHRYPRLVHKFGRVMALSPVEDNLSSTWPKRLTVSYILSFFLKNNLWSSRIWWRLPQGDER